MSKCITHSRKPTTKRYSVVVNSIDPPLPVLISNTNSEKVARKYFEELKQIELQAYKKTGTYGGEWEIKFFKHPDKPTIKFWAVDDPEPDWTTSIYAIDYPSSELLDSFGYMDFLT